MNTLPQEDLYFAKHGVSEGMQNNGNIGSKQQSTFSPEYRFLSLNVPFYSLNVLACVSSMQFHIS